MHNYQTVTGVLWWSQLVQQLFVSGLVRQGLITIKVGFQYDCAVTAGETDLEQRTQIQNGGWDMKFYPAFS
jgi:hypothetical protein